MKILGSRWEDIFFLQGLKSEFWNVKQQFAVLQTQVEDLKSTVSQLRDENMLLRAQANTGLGQTTDSNTTGNETFCMLEEARAEANRWKAEIKLKDNLICKLVSVMKEHQAT
jgi:regulator of replication initiation timing